ncbi:hypothetical protein GXW82_10620 [Streptacidiphilus sp. 4-A2]|nr:hypothetical protein [Streptacidiphilus sp. 4-A2]
MDRFAELSWGEILDEFLQIAGAALINTAENVAITLLDALPLLVRPLKAILQARWDIPVLTYVYEEVICGGDGSRLTLLDLIALLTAIPSTVVYKALVPGHRTCSPPARPPPCSGPRPGTRRCGP